MKAAAWLAIAIALVAGDAASHATLVASSPADGERLAQSPAGLVLEFNESVAPLSITLTDSAGKRHSLAGASAQGSRVSLALPAPLDAGGYVASYRVTSADSHVVAGAIAFSIGEHAVPAVAGEAAGAASPLFSLSRALRDLAVLALAGMAMYALLVAEFPAATRVHVATAVAAIVASLVAVGFKGSELAGEGIFPDTRAWRLGVSSPQAVGAAIAIGASIAAMFGTIALPRRYPLLALAAVALVASTVIGGHAFTAALRPVAIAVLATHIAGVAFWAGSLVALLLTLRASPPPDSARALAKFSGVATIAVPTAIAAGAVFAALELATMANLTATRYGELVIAKFVITLVLLALATANRCVWTPALARGDGRAAGRLRASIAVEMLLVALVVVIAAELSRTPPPRDNSSIVATRTVSSGDATATVSLRLDGQRRAFIDIAFHHREHRILDPVEVTLEFAHRRAGIEPLERRARRIEAGHYRVNDLPPAVAGAWTIVVRARIDDFTRIDLATELPLGGN